MSIIFGLLLTLIMALYVLFYNGKVVLALIIIVTVVSVTVYFYKKFSAEEKRIAQERAEKQTKKLLDRFYVECVLAEANDFSKPKQKQMAQLLANKYGLEYPNGIEALYQKGRNDHNAISQRIEHDWLEGKRVEEREEWERLNKYSDLTGREKRIAILSAEANMAGAAASACMRLANFHMDTMTRGMEKEKDWAVQGGAASAFAGPAAGVAVAINAQMQNMQIREKNEKIHQDALSGYNAYMEQAQGRRWEASRIRDEIESVKMKLISDEPAANLMKKISFDKTSISVSETGAALVRTSASIESDFKIFGDVPAVVDGTILAQIYDGKQLCGTAKLVLPKYGLGQNIPLNGICIDCCKPGKSYTVKFIAKNLWAMEK